MVESCDKEKNPDGSCTHLCEAFVVVEAVLATVHEELVACLKEKDADAVWENIMYRMNNVVIDITAARDRINTGEALVDTAPKEKKNDSQ